MAALNPKHLPHHVFLCKTEIQSRNKILPSEVILKMKKGLLEKKEACTLGVETCAK